MTTLSTTNRLVTEGGAWMRAQGISNSKFFYRIIGDHVHMLSCMFDNLMLFAVVEPHHSGYGEITKTSVCRICDPDAPKTQRQILADLPDGSMLYRTDELMKSVQVINPDEPHGYTTVYANGNQHRVHVTLDDYRYADSPDGRAAANVLILEFRGHYTDRYGFGHTGDLNPKFLTEPGVIVIPLPEFVVAEDDEPWPHTEQARTLAKAFRPLAVRVFATRHLPAHARQRYVVDIELKQATAHLSEFGRMPGSTPAA